MNNRLTLIMTVSVLIGFAVILLMNVASLMGYIPPKYLSPNDVKGIAIEHNEVLYTLNFEQQNSLVDIFNRSVPVTKQLYELKKSKIKSPAQVQKIIIYRFNAPDLIIKPVGYVNKKNSASPSDQSFMIYSSPEWNSEGYMEESAPDEMNKLLLKTYGN